MTTVSNHKFMIKYEIAKTLKDAGFTQKQGENCQYYIFALNYAYTDYEISVLEKKAKDENSESRFEKIFAPTFSDLVEDLDLCDITSLEITKEWSGEWIAKLFVDVDLGFRYQGSGETAEEALAGLWLAYKGKRQTPELIDKASHPYDHPMMSKSAPKFEVGD